MPESASDQLLTPGMGHWNHSAVDFVGCQHGETDGNNGEDELGVAIRGHGITPLGEAPSLHQERLLTRTFSSERCLRIPIFCIPGAKAGDWVLPTALGWPKSAPATG
jgi:hypothetical protein